MNWDAYPPADLRERFLRLLPAFRPGEKVVVAFSGGADSTFLIWMAHHLVRLRGVEPVAAYLNHGQRPDAPEEEAHVRSVLATWRHPWVVGRLRVQVERNMEHVLRRYRYRFLTRVRRHVGARFILTAHTAEDMVETLLLQMARGGGGTFTGIPLCHRQVLRPMLLLSRREIRRALGDAGIPWYEDPSNRDPRMLRNRFREMLDVIPSPVSVARDALARQALFRALEAGGGLALTRAWRPSLPGSLRLDRTVLAGYDMAPVALALASRFPLLRREWWVWWPRLGEGEVEMEVRGYRVVGGEKELWVGRTKELAPRRFRVGRLVLPEANLVLRIRPARDGAIPEGEWEVRGVRPGDRMGEERVGAWLRRRGIPQWAWPLWPVVAKEKDVVWMLGAPPVRRGPGYTIEVSKHEPESFGISDLAGSPA